MLKRFTLGDALRGIAAIGVVALHTRLPLPFAEFNALWPDFFFVLSGLVLAKYYRAETSEISFAKFAAKRAVRFYPLVLVALLSYLIIVVVTSHIGTTDAWPAALTPLNFVAALALLQVFYPASTPVLYPLWSLSAELVVNLGAFALFRKYGTRALIAAAVLGTAATTWQVSLNPTDISPPFLGLAAVSRALTGFALGLLIQRFPLSKARGLGLAATIAALFALVWFANVSPYATVAAPLIFAAALRYAYLAEDRFATTRFTRVAEFLGTSSFGIYVWHEALLPVALKVADKLFGFNSTPMRIALFVILLGLTLAVTRLTYRWVEKPTMNWINARTRR